MLISKFLASFISCYSQTVHKTLTNHLARPYLNGFYFCVSQFLHCNRSIISSYISSTRVIISTNKRLAINWNRWKNIKGIVWKQIGGKTLKTSYENKYEAFFIISLSCQKTQNCLWEPEILYYNIQKIVSLNQVHSLTVKNL